MAIVVSDAFTDTAGTSLASHTGGTGATWTLHPIATGTAAITAGNRVRFDGPNGQAAYYTASGVPASAEYDVTWDLHFASTADDHNVGPIGRASTSAETFYNVFLTNGSTTTVELWKAVAGTWNILGSYAITRSAGLTYALKFEIRNASKKVYVDGVERISSGDSDAGLTAAGRAGLLLSSVATPTDSTGAHLDNFVVDDLTTAGSLLPFLIGHDLSGGLQTMGL